MKPIKIAFYLRHQSRTAGVAGFFGHGIHVFFGLVFIAKSKNLQLCEYGLI